MSETAQSTLGEYGAQSALAPEGVGATAINGLTIGMTVAFGLIFVLLLLFVWAVVSGRLAPRHWWIWAGGIALPLVSVLILMGFSTVILQRITSKDPEALVIEVTGKQFWWDVVYDPEGWAMRGANEIVIPKGRAVTFRLKSSDVIHSFWVPKLTGKMDMIPGRVNSLPVMATETGRFRGQCAEFCGLSHPKMAFEVVVMEPEDFDAWMQRSSGEARDAATTELTRGRDVFVEAGCPACHTIRGVAEGGDLGPDLTRVGGRGSLGAGMYRMNQGTLAGWIADPTAMKPGAKMPSYNHLPGPDLRALSAYLASLK
ncbi:cytochrome c oxidase subunit II [Sulfitobacter delicatus]|uniref:Cytochrome aa3 subunit 2 n=1 Tax=Sulfitobacter delicatus TaxID=218672 RepID=A0A1G7TTZ9_9RHOB|nr:cytochrome c oxidase subunit II [Sulfitobacter delicatus]SDG38712.1 cytochrome c oxidase subunit 2 [Sulfitobacter delicatus]